MITMPDPKWLEILKASGWQTTALAAAFGSFILMIHLEWFLDIPSWVLPIAYAGFLVCLFLAISSIMRFIYDYCSSSENIFSDLVEKRAWMKKIKNMSDDARLLLSTLEEDSDDSFYYDPRAKEIDELRNLEIIEANLISNGGERWGKFLLSFKYKRYYDRHRAIFRSELKYSHKDSQRVRLIMQKARNLANGRI